MFFMKDIKNTITFSRKDSIIKFINESKSALILNQPEFYEKKISKIYFKEILLSLIINNKLFFIEKDHFWLYEGNVYKKFYDLLNNEQILIKITNMKKSFKLSIPQLMKLDPMLDDIIFLPLDHQITILQNSIMQLIINSGRQKNSVLITNGKILFDQFLQFKDQYEDSFITVLFERYQFLLEMTNYTDFLLNKANNQKSKNIFDFIS